MNGNESLDGPVRDAAPRTTTRASAGFPLASLALLVTVVASLLACADMDRWREQYVWLTAEWPWRVVGLFGGAALFGGFIGTVYLFVASTNRRARLIAPFIGILAAEIGLLILIAPGPMWRTIFAVGVLLVTATLLRLGAE